MVNIVQIAEIRYFLFFHAICARFVHSKSTQFWLILKMMLWFGKDKRNI